MSTAPSSRSTPLSRSSPMVPSTRATSPPTSPATIPEDIKADDDVEGEVVEPNLPKDDNEEQDEVVSERLAQLENLIQRSGEYVKLLKTQMDQVKVNYGARRQKPKSEVKAKPKTRNTRKRARVVSDSEEEREVKRTKAGGAQGEGAGKAEEDQGEKKYTFQQPALVTGATLKDYQLEGVAWMAGLHQNGISGILADEMGLGKTIQTIAFHAFLRERTVAPFMVVCPLAVLDNWAKEFARFAPDIPVVTYYGTKEERAEIRRTQMVMDAVDLEFYRSRATSHAAALAAAAAAVPSKGKGKGKGKGKAAAHSSSKARGHGRGRPAGRGRAARDDDSSEDEAPPRKSRRTAATRGRRGGRAPAKARKQPLSEADSDEFEDSMTVDEEIPPPAEQRNKHPLKPLQRTNFPVVLTTYQMIINDRAELSRFHWGFIVVDEGHRLKNIDCVLMREIKKIPADARMVLTGTPLQNNLAELWALLNFVLPDLFGDLSTFQSWFDESRLQSKLTSERETKLIHSLHDILRPFLLRRMKADVEMTLPPKKEYVLYTPLSERQRALYDVVVQGDKALRQHLIDEIRAEEERLNGSGGKLSDEEEERPLLVVAKEKVRAGKGLRQKVERDYVESEDEDGEGYFKRLDEGQMQVRKEKERSGHDIGREWQMRVAVKEVNNKNLKNVIMQLRKVCQHPFLFHWPKDARTRQPVLGDELVTTSGKMMVLERLLDALFARGHKVLLFSQFTTMLDIIEDWADEHKGWPVCRIDGSMDMESRREDIRRFQEGGDAPDAPRLFLLSTRSGGLGLNLVQADTVIFYDQDWNPQADLQAQDRAHRIGQTKPVLIFRLLCAHTMETKIMQRATDKRKLEALVIAKGEFVNPTAAATRNKNKNKNQALAELAMELHRLEGERIQVVPSSEAGKASVISDVELEMLLDRRPEVFLDRQKGWTSGGGPVEADLEGGHGHGHGLEVVEAVKAAAPDAKGTGTGTRTAFAVYEAPVHGDGNVLGMMDVEDEGEE